MVLPGKGMGWKEFFKALGTEYLNDNIGNVAGAVTFAALLALFPFLLFLVALAGADHRSRAGAAAHPGAGQGGARGGDGDHRPAAQGPGLGQQRGPVDVGRTGRHLGGLGWHARR